MLYTVKRLDLKSNNIFEIVHVADWKTAQNILRFFGNIKGSYGEVTDYKRN